VRLTDRQIICELARLGEVHPNHFKGDGNGYAVGRLVRSGFAEWVRGRLPHSATATALRITDSGRQSVAFEAKRTALEQSKEK
jgi:hypothetical protein